MKKLDAALPDAIDMMARALRAGHAMTAAINIVAEQSQEPARSEFGEVFKQQNFGLPIRDAMTQMLDRVLSPDLAGCIPAFWCRRRRAATWPRSWIARRIPSASG